MPKRITHWLVLVTLAASLAITSCDGTSRTVSVRPAVTRTLTPPQCYKSVPTSCLAMGKPPTPTPDSAAPFAFAVLPLFSDWRIAYLTDANVLHAYALDGTSDLTGLALGYVQGTPALSPDGRTLAYLTGANAAGGRLMLVRLAQRTQSAALTSPAIFGFTVRDANWSQDSHWLAISGYLNGALAIYLVDAQSGAASQVPGTLWDGVNAATGGGEIFGWMDASHLVIGSAKGDQVLDVNTGAATVLTLPGSTRIALLSPDGRRALLSTSGCGASPEIYLFDLANGTVRDLKAISAAAPGAPPRVWQPGTSLAAGVVGPTLSQPTAVAIFDLDADTYTALPTPGDLFPYAWLPDGQTLLLAQWNIVSEHFAYYLDQPFAPGSQLVALPGTVTNFFGFVRTGDGAAQDGGPPAFVAAPLGVSFAGRRGIAHESPWLWGASSC